jgi:long-subunit acyl-CoA synthetase (AMP-forming)
MINAPASHDLGYKKCVLHNIQMGGAVVYHTQQLRDIGFIPEIILDDMVETNVDHTLLFPFHIAEIKKLFDSHHPHCEKWKKFLCSRSKYFLNTGGAPMSDKIDNWFFETFGFRTTQIYGSSESGPVMISDFSVPALPGEETYLTKYPHIDIYFKPIDNNDPNIGELYVHSPTLTTGYIRKAEKDEFYESNVPGMRTDIEADDLFIYINGEKFYKTNDIWNRSPKSGKYKYISRLDDIIVFSTGLKMNPLPFENTVSLECNDITCCCLMLDDTKTEVVCFVEPQWENIILEDGKPMNVSIDSSTLSQTEIGKLNKIAQKQVWNSIYNLLMDDSKS